MLWMATRARGSGGSATWRPLVALGPVLCAGILLAHPAAGVAAAAKTTRFSGRIVSGTGRYAGSRGRVRLLLRSTAVGTPPSPGGSASYTFALALSAPACAGAPVTPGRCVALSGTLRGTSVVVAVNPDLPKTARLTGHGRVAPLGATSAGGTASGVGFIRVGRFQLSLHLRTGAGSITISAQGPRVPGFSSPTF